MENIAAKGCLKGQGEQRHSDSYWLTVITVVIACWLHTSAASTVCPDELPQFRPAEDTPYRDKVFLNLNQPINCNGTVSAWRVCYYSPEPATLEETEDYSVVVGVWRKMRMFYGIIEGYSELKHEVIQRRGSSLLQQEFRCITLPLASEDMFDVKVGDVVGFHTLSADLGDNDEILNLGASTSEIYQTWYIAKRSPRNSCQVDDVSFMRTSCFVEGDYVYGHTMHVSVILEQAPGPVTDVPQSVSTATVSPITSTGDETLTTAVSKSSSDSVTSSGAPQDMMRSTTSSLPDQNGLNDQETFGRSRLIVPMASSFGSVILIALILILIVVASIVMVKFRQRRRLLNIEVRKNGHHHVGLDHFVIVSDNAVVPSGSILSSSLEACPYEKPRSTLSPGSIIENRHIIVSDSLSNPIYGLDNDCIYQTIPNGESIYEAPGERDKMCVSYEVPVEQQTMTKSAVLDPRLSDANHGTGNVLDQDLNAVVVNTGTQIECKQPQCDETACTQSKPKLAIDPQRYSAVLCEHYYKVLEEELNSTGVDVSEKREMYTTPATNMDDLYAQVHKQKVNKLSDKDIKITGQLGSGQFGRVYRGTWKSSPKGGDTVEVAVKTLVAKEKVVSRVKLLQEAAIMGQFLHPNVIQLLGVITKKDTLMLVIELASKGDLNKLLVSMLPDPGELLAPDTDRLLLGYCQQVAFGMHYLATKGFVHRDLAARNILVTHDNVLKIADFGMSRDLAEENYYISQGGKVPVKWTAPEAINYMKYSTASDVWSYGCLLYEIWSLGQAPFTDCSNSEALEKLQRGYRLPPPPGCSRTIYSIMIKCWHPDAQARPTFKGILFELLGLEGDAALKVPEEDSATHKLASLIGGPLEAGEKLYTDLQWKYFTADEHEQQL